MTKETIFRIICKSIALRIFSPLRAINKLVNPTVKRQPKIDVNPAVTVSTTGYVTSTSVSTQAKAQSAISQIKSAISSLNETRAKLGAIQNRLEHTINNLNNVVENTTAAESQIRDTDMASEMVRYSNNNILAQAGQSMLAQANQSNQGVLSLLG